MKDYEEFISETIENATDNIRTQLNRAYMYGHEQGKKVSCNYRKEDMESEYNRGLNEAWEAARKIILNDSLSWRKLIQIFGTASLERIMKRNTASEAISKIKEYEEQQKQFAVGDEVYSDAFDDKGIITHITTDKVSCVCIICNGSTMMKVGTNGLHKTGRTFPKIAEVLAEMRGESE